MGAAASKPGTDEKVFLSETPIQFSPEVVDQLSDRAANPHPSPERQSTLDAHIRSRIQAELENLRSQEDHVRQQIEQALEKENLDRERGMAGEDGAVGGVKTSAALQGDLEEIQAKIDRFHKRRELGNFPVVVESREKLIACYRSHPTTTLDCWREVENFKAAVAQVEQDYLKTLQ